MAIEPKKKRSANPVTALSNGLEEDLQRQGYGGGTIWKQRRLFNDLLIWLEGQQLAMADLTVAKVDRFMADRRAAGVRKLKTRKALGAILVYLRGLGLVPSAENPVENCGFREVPDSNYGKSRTRISVSPGQGFH